MKSGPIESSEATEGAVPAVRVKSPVRGISVSVLDLILRFIGVFGTFGSAVAMGTTAQTVPVFTQFILRARYKDLPAFTFFVIANSIVRGYLFLSLPVSIFHFIRNTKISRSRAILLALDTFMLALLTSGASAAAAIVYLVHEGNGGANWPAFCGQFDDFCERISGSLIDSFAAVVSMIVMIIASASSLTSASQYKLSNV